MSGSALPIFSGNGRIEVIKAVSKTPVSSGVYSFPIKQYTEQYIRWYRKSPLGVEYLASWSIITPFSITLNVREYHTNQVIATGFYGVGVSGQNVDELTLTLQENTIYELEYSLYCRDGSANIYEANVKYNIGVVKNQLPLKKWTIEDVIDRCCDLIEPLRYGEKPRFRLEEKIRKELEKIISPEFVFTKMTFREQMKMIGGYIHGEFRITEPHFNENKVWFSFTFDKYGGTEKSWISNRTPISITCRTDINDYCTSLDSQAENLVNQLNWAQGVITEPFIGGIGKSLRTDTTTARMSESDGTFIPTNYPIYAIGGNKKVYCTNVGALVNDNTIGDIDITPYIFEKVEYDNISSYDGIYPYSKSYALYYTQGEKNIKGLFFKAEHAISPVFKRYAIINILEQAVGKTINISGQDLMKLAFRVTYLPIFNTRVKTNKRVVKKGLPRSLAYNQSANIVESQYYGENLKGTVERMGNPEKTFTYLLGHLSDVPKIGMKFDDDYYISNVSTEILPAYIKCSVSISKHFNRLSQYVGISSEKRMWEVSEKQAFSRESLIPEYILITKDPNKTSDGIFTQTQYVAKVLFNQFFTSPVSACLVRPLDIERQLIHNNYSIVLPVTSSAFGNSMIFNFRFEDNYNAGQKSIYVDGDKSENDNVTGYWGAYIPYCDYYGRFRYLDFTLWADNIGGLGTTTELDLPQVNTPIPGPNAGFVNVGTSNPFRYEKDSREIPSITYQLSAVTDDESILIGSALMGNCNAINADPIDGYNLVLFKEKINEIDSQMRGYDIAYIYNSNDEEFFTINNDNIVLKAQGEKHVAWAITTKAVNKTIKVEAENGEQTEQTIAVGGELVIGQNKPLTEDLTLYFRVKRSVYD